MAYAQNHGPTHGTGADGKPLWSQADQFFDPDDMAKARAKVLHHAGGQTYWLVMGDRLEVQPQDGEEAFVWDGQGYWGGDINKLFIKTEGEASVNGAGARDAEVQALWSRAVSTYFDLQAGVRYDFEPEGRVHAVLGFQGLAPYFFEVDAAAFLSDDGDLTARVELEYDLLLTQRLILQPRIEANFSAQDILSLNVGSGVTSFDAGLRLRYEIKREFAPYIGVEWQSAFGRTADLMRAGGEDPNAAVFVFGVRTWF